MTLTDAQIEFLRFAHERPKPFAWRYLGDDGAPKKGPPYAAIEARKSRAGGELTCQITIDELEGLRPYWLAPLHSLNEAGLSIIGRG